MPTPSDPRLGEYWTIAYLVRDGGTCLAESTRGPGKGRINGYGGKGAAPVPPAWTMQLELQKESGGVIPVRWEQRAWLDFYFNGLHVPAHAYAVTEFLGEPRSTAEMRDPRWYPFRGVPYGKRMWPDDGYWLPLVLAGEKVRGTIRIRDGELEEEPLVLAA